MSARKSGRAVLFSARSGRGSAGGRQADNLAHPQRPTVVRWTPLPSAGSPGRWSQRDTADTMPAIFPAGSTRHGERIFSQ